jgi:demethoxyubiquinone hydroxylase (CLK1/Coq7/Cat5 family)
MKEARGPSGMVPVWKEEEAHLEWFQYGRRKRPIWNGSSMEEGRGPSGMVPVWKKEEAHLEWFQYIKKKNTNSYLVQVL